jgi:anti-sigma regulatory factor (Ser/Thr protein kinase)
MRRDAEVPAEAIANAVEHAYPKGEPGPIEVRAREVGDEFAVVVADHGGTRVPQPRRWTDRVASGSLSSRD